MSLKSEDDTNPYERLVPNYMRTKRKIPRLLALSLCALSALCFSYGTNALARIQMGDKSSVLDSIRSEKSSYTLVSGEATDTCLGALSIELNPKESVEHNSLLTIKSDFNVGTLENSHRISLVTRADFDYLGKLQDLDIKFTLGTLGTLKIRGGLEDQPMIATLTDTSGKSESISLFAIAPIYLRERAEGIYRLRLPKDLEKIQSSNSLLSNNSLRINPTDASGEQVCTQQLATQESQPLINLPLANSGFTIEMLQNALKQIKKRGLND